MHAALVGSGIFLSRVLGLVRESLKARYLGASESIAADAFTAAFRIPNLLQNLLGEAALSSSFIPVYANALARGDKDEAGRIAGAIGSILALVAAGLVLIGVLFAPAIVAVVAPGYEGERRALTIMLTRILFPGAALFVFSAWCLGILNSHRRFFLSYSAPVAWNLAMIVALLMYRHETTAELARRIAWASVIGAALQFLVQVPTVLRVSSSLRASLGRGNANVRKVITNFGPASISRGVAQISSYLDQFIASYLPLGAVSLLFYTQTLTMLPISLFGIAVAAAELPAMSSSTGSDDETRAHVRQRLNGGLRHIAFFVIPSAVAFMTLGDVIAAALYQGGKFTVADTRFVWGILAAASIGVLGTALSRLYSSAFFALHDTRSPLRIALIRVTVAATLGASLAFLIPRALGVDGKWGTAGLTFASSVAGWVELTLLRSRLNRQLGDTGLPARLLMTLAFAAIGAGATGVVVKLVSLNAGVHRYVIAALALGAFAIVYGGVTRIFGVPEAIAVSRKLRLERRTEG